MALFWLLVCFITFFSNFVYSDNSESNLSKTGERDESPDSQHLNFESNSYPSQSMHSSNGYNSNQNSMSLSESNNAQIYGSGHQTNDQYDQKERKTLILAIPVKLKLNSEQDNHDQSLSQSESDSSQIQSQSLLYSKSLPYQSPYSQLNSHSTFMSSNSDESDSNQSNGVTLTPLTPLTPLAPLSHKIYSSLDSQLKSASYSPLNTQKSVSEQSSSHTSPNEPKYKNPYQTKDMKVMQNQYVKDMDTIREYPIRGEYKGLSVKAEESDYESDNRDNSRQIRPNNDKSEQISYDDSYEARLKQKERAKQLYDSIPNNKPEYDYDSTEEEEEEEDNEKRVQTNYYSHKDYRNNKNGFNTNIKKNQFPKKSIGPIGTASGKPNAAPQLHHSHKGLGQSLPVFSADFESWPQYYYSKPNLNFNDWSGVPETIDTNLLNLNLFNGFKINNQNKENLRNPMYAPAFDLLSDGQLKAASNPIPTKTMRNSKIYGQAAKYQTNYPSLNLFTGQPVNFRDYSLIDLNGDIYPAPLLGQTPHRKQRIPLIQKESMITEYNRDYNSGNRDLIKPHRRNPLLLRPSFMSGLRSVASKPLANYSPFASASSTHSFLSVLPSLQTSFNINAKSIPRQIFPLLYG